MESPWHAADASAVRSYRYVITLPGTPSALHPKSHTTLPWSQLSLLPLPTFNLSFANKIYVTFLSEITINKCEMYSS